MDAIYKKLRSMEDEITELKEELIRSKSTVVKLEKKLTETQRKVDKIKDVEKLCKSVSAKSENLTRLQHVLNSFILKAQKSGERGFQIPSESQQENTEKKSPSEQTATTFSFNPGTPRTGKLTVPPVFSSPRQQQGQQQKQQQQQRQQQPPQTSPRQAPRQFSSTAPQAQRSQKPSPTHDAPQAQTQRGPLHPGVQCDGCQGQVYGVRYKCKICPDYDLCSSCKAKNIHRLHPMEEIKQPRIPSASPAVSILHDLIQRRQETRRNRPEGLDASDLIDILNPGGRLFGSLLSNLEDSSDEEKSDEDISTEGGKGQLHPNVRCDGCKGSVYGIRYKCRTCDDFDLCSSCEAKGVHGHHGMHMISKP